MTKDKVEKMENSELLTYFLISRDNLISIRRAINDNPQATELNSLFEMEDRHYTKLLKEIYRRMNYGRKKR